MRKITLIPLFISLALSILTLVFLFILPMQEVAASNQLITTDDIVIEVIRLKVPSSFFILH